MSDTQRVFLAPKEFGKELATELARANIRAEALDEDRLFLASDAGAATPAWAQNIWLHPERIEFTSINDAAKKLKALGRNWALYSFKLHRRAQLIQDALPKIKGKPVEFLATLPTQPMGAWTLLDANTLLASPATNLPFPLGEMKFTEDKLAPPSRAYLKLWELFTVHNIRPQAGERCLDLGATPGGWTWVLANLGCVVEAVDKAPLDPKIAKLQNVEFRKASAFSLAPDSENPVAWLFSDVICYPERLWKFVERWLKAEGARNFVCTIKFQGKTDFETMEKFARVPGSRLLHLHHNKHELTWVSLATDRNTS